MGENPAFYSGFSFPIFLFCTPPNFVLQPNTFLLSSRKNKRFFDIFCCKMENSCCQFATCYDIILINASKHIMYAVCKISVQKGTDILPFWCVCHAGTCGKGFRSEAETFPPVGSLKRKRSPAGAGCSHWIQESVVYEIFHKRALRPPFDG